MKGPTMSCQDFTFGKANLIFEELKLSQFEFLLAYEGIVWVPWQRMVVHK